nr:MAG TPA: hypothetical protein [Caudoviricetes sp.]
MVKKLFQICGRKEIRQFVRPLTLLKELPTM